MIVPRSQVHDVDGLLARLRPVLESGWLTTGPQCEELEAELSRYFGRPVVAVSHGTAALQLLVRNLIPDRSKKIVVPANTFSATLSAPLLEGHEIVLVDIDHEMQLSLEALQAIADSDKDHSIGGVIARLLVEGWEHAGVS